MDLLDEVADVVRSFTGTLPARTDDGGLALPNGFTFYPGHLAERLLELDDVQRGAEMRRTVTDLLLPDELEGITWAEVRPLLRAAVRPVDPRVPVLARELSVDLQLQPFVDLPTMFTNVTEARLGQWGVTLDQVLETGLDQLPTPQVEGTDVDGMPLVVVQGEDLMTTGWLARLTDLVDVTDAAVAAPARQMLLVSPFMDGVEPGATVGAVARAAASMSVRLRGGISPHAYWWRQGSTMLPRWRSTGQADAVRVEADPDAAPRWAGDA